MIKVLIVDDEPLVVAGVRSMVNNLNTDFTVCATASNGTAALELIEKERPEIVIADIKMPQMDGLTLAKICRERFGHLPVFIILTSYEEFSLVKEALSYQVSDYLVKLELDEQTLSSTLKKAAAQAEEYLASQSRPLSSPPDDMRLLKEQFFTRLLHHLFESEEQFFLQSRDLGLTFDEDAYIACCMEILSDKLASMDRKQQLTLYRSALQMTESILKKYMPCHCVSLDLRHFSLIIPLSDQDRETYIQKLIPAFTEVRSMLFNYYSVRIVGAVGHPVSNPLDISSSYQDARQTFSLVSKEEPFLFSDQTHPARKEAAGRTFNLSLFQPAITKAYEEYDSEKLKDVFSSITSLFADHPSAYVQAMDAASSILYLSLSLLSDGEAIVSSIFRDVPDNYRSLYRQTTTPAVLNWLNTLYEGLDQVFVKRRKDHKHKMVSNIQAYIHDHLHEKLSLNEVAAAFGISPNYLSLLFGRYSEYSFSEFVTRQKIQEAKRMLLEGNRLVYEIADQLGFENAFYFSTVFKKIEGCSPREFMNRKN